MKNHHGSPPTIKHAHPSFSFIEKIMIQHAHPAKLSTDILGILVGWYLLWMHQLLLALIALFGASVLGTLLVWKQNVRQLAESRLGTWMIGQAHPGNLVVRSAGFFVICYGFWSHSSLYFPIGAIMIIAARFLGAKTPE
jgi:hypothetical protein